MEYPILQQVVEFLDTIPPSLRRKSVVECKKFLYLQFLIKDTSCPAILSPRELIDKVGGLVGGVKKGHKHVILEWSLSKNDDKELCCIL